MRKVASILLCIFMLSTLCSCMALSMLNAATSKQPHQPNISPQPIESSMPDFPISSQNEPALSSLSPSSELEISQPPVSSQSAPISSSMPSESSSKPEPKPSGIKVDLFDGLCTVTLPESWKGRYVIEEYVNVYGEEGVEFYNKKNYNGEYGGWLFSIIKSSEYKSKNDFMQNCPMSGMGGYLTKYSDGIIYWHWVTDVQYDYSIEELRKDYQSMEKQIDKVLDSLVVNE